MTATTLPPDGAGRLPRPTRSRRGAAPVAAGLAGRPSDSRGGPGRTAVARGAGPGTPAGVEPAAGRRRMGGTGLAGRARRPGRGHRRAARLPGGDERGVGPGTGQRDRRLQHRPGHHGLRHRRAEGAIPASRCCGATRSGPRGCPSPTPGTTSPPSGPAAVATATSSCSTARRRGTASATWPTGVSCTCAPIPTWPSTRASAACSSTSGPPASRSDRCGPSPVTSPSPSCSSPMSGSRRRRLLGPLHQGWTVAMTTLSYERAGVARLHLGLSKKLDHLLAEPGAARRPGRPPHPRPGGRHLRRHRLHAVDDQPVAGTGAERPAVRDGGEHGQAGVGPRRSRSWPTWPWTCSARRRRDGSWAYNLAAARQTTIAGGTTEINLNILGEMGLGPPPRAEAGLSRQPDRAVGGARSLRRGRPPAPGSSTAASRASPTRSSRSAPSSRTSPNPLSSQPNTPGASV